PQAVVDRVEDVDATTGQGGGVAAVVDERGTRRGAATRGDRARGPVVAEGGGDETVVPVRREAAVSRRRGRGRRRAREQRQGARQRLSGSRDRLDRHR